MAERADDGSNEQGGGRSFDTDRNRRAQRDRSSSRDRSPSRDKDRGVSPSPTQNTTATRSSQTTIDPNLLAAINAAAGQFGIETDEDGNFTGFSPVQFQDFSGLSDVAQQQIDFGSGRTTDPRFENLRGGFQEFIDATRSSIDFGGQQQRGQQSEFFTRRGLANSSAARNDAAKLERNLAVDRTQQLSALAKEKAGIGIQEFNAQQNALNFGSSLTQSIAESSNRRKQLELATTAAGIEVLSLPTQLKISETAAANAGDVGSGDSGGGLFGK